MTTIVRIITPDEESELKELMASDDPITSWHAHCILMSAEEGVMMYILNKCPMGQVTIRKGDRLTGQFVVQLLHK